MGLYGGARPVLDIPAIAATMREQEEPWMQGLVQVVYPNIDGDTTFNPWTNERSGGEPIVVLQSKARIQPIRSAQNVNGAFEGGAIRGVRFKVPLNTFVLGGIPLREGLQVTVLDGGEDDDLMRYRYAITNGINSSLAWNRTIEAIVDLGAVQTPPELVTPWPPAGN
jgi:hypothetical protein